MTNFADFINPDTIQLLSFGERFIISLYVTMLGMGITFTALVSIWGITVLMSKVIVTIENRSKVAAALTTSVSGAAPEPVAQASATVSAGTAPSTEEDENLIAVLTAAIAASLNTSMHNIVVRNIRTVPDQAPIWTRVGRTEQMSSRF
jgi:Na+-transporting methylmalonyl-CoA/oxaloacetate decarboxylase gamma subunit